MTDPVDRHLRALMARLNDMTPLPPSFDELTLVDGAVTAGVGGRRRGAAWAVTGAAVLVASAGLLVVTQPERSPTLPLETPPPAPATASATGSAVTSGNVAGLWVFATRAVPVDEYRVGTGWPLPSPLAAYRYESDGTARGFDGCNQTTQAWELVDGQLQTPAAPHATGGSTAALCVDSSGNTPLTIPAVPHAMSVLGGVPTLLHSNADGSTARAVRVEDLPAPEALGGTTGVLAIDGVDLTISFLDDGTVELTTGVASCSAGRYRYADRHLQLNLSTPQPACANRQLGVLMSGPLQVASYSDGYAADTLLLASERGAVRLFPPGTSTTEAEGG